jgi:D-arabinose 1-dehydrogenase-like Zn-dependent alcohol dehydrogenase
LRFLGIALEYLRPNGALVAVGLPKDAAINAPIFTTVVKSLRILGVHPSTLLNSKTPLG